jgi:hypothetical protein
MNFHYTGNAIHHTRETSLAQRHLRQQADQLALEAHQ